VCDRVVVGSVVGAGNLGESVVVVWGSPCCRVVAWLGVVMMGNGD
jgi:hypothetical protein